MSASNHDVWSRAVTACMRTISSVCISSRLFRCLGPLHRRPQRNAVHSRNSSQHVVLRETVAATLQDCEEPLAQHSTSQTSQRLSAWHHEAKVSHVCPACGQRILRLPVLERHFKNCCPDLISPQVSCNLNSRDFWQLQINRRMRCRPCKLLTAMGML